MKNLLTVLLFILLSLPITTAQSFQEVCANANTNGTIVNFETYKDTIYATGFFNTICGASVGYIAKWEENQWKPSAINITDPGHALRVINDQLYIARYEESIDSNWVYYYDDSGLNKLGEGVYLSTASGFSELPNIYDIIEYNGKIVACGEFDRVGQQSINGIMQWNGNSWEALGNGLTSNIQNTAPVVFPHQMLVHNDELYVAGNFKTAGSTEVNGIAKWNGSEWQALGDGFNSTVYSIGVYNDEIIAGGSFTTSGSTTLNRIAKWNGSSWEALSFGFTPSSSNDFIFVHTLKVIDEILYIGGGLKEITYADNSTEVCNGIISLENGIINTFEGGVPNNDIEAIIKVDDTQLLVGGGVFGSGYSGISNISVSVSNLEDSNSVKLAPNPFIDEISILSDQSFEHYQLIDLYGRTIKKGAFEQTLHLDVQAGVYFIQLTDGNTTSTLKVIRQ